MKWPPLGFLSCFAFALGGEDPPRAPADPRPAVSPASLRRRARAGTALVWVLVFLLGCRIEKTEEESSSERRLESLAYLNWVPDASSSDQGNVTLFDSDRASPGLNLFTSRPRMNAHLLTMAGEVVHGWSRETPLIADPDPAWKTILEREKGWVHVEPGRDRSLFVVGNYAPLYYLDRDSEVIWRADVVAHHDLEVGDDAIFVLTADRLDEVEGALGLPIIDSVVTVLNHDGASVRTISLTRVLSGDEELAPILEERLRAGASAFDRRWNEEIPARIESLESSGGKLSEATDPKLVRLHGASAMVRAAIEGELPSAVQFLVFENTGQHLDPIHANSIESLHTDVPGLGREGDLLVGSRNLDLIFVLDPVSETVVWSWGNGELEGPHDPSVLADGHVLVFDNGRRRGSTRILEVDPESREIVWQYEGKPPASFFSESRGAAQRLSNGNTLITESDKGRAFEVSAQGEIVWEFFNPDTRGSGDSKSRAAIYRLTRLEDG